MGCCHCVPTMYTPGSFWRSTFCGKTRRWPTRERRAVFHEICSMRCPIYRRGKSCKHNVHPIQETRSNHPTMAIWARRNKGNMSLVQGLSQAHSNQGGGGEGAEELDWSWIWSRSIKGKKQNICGDSRRYGHPMGQLLATVADFSC